MLTGRAAQLRYVSLNAVWSLVMVLVHLELGGMMFSLRVCLGPFFLHVHGRTVNRGPGSCYFFVVHARFARRWIDFLIPGRRTVVARILAPVVDCLIHRLA